MGKINVTRSSLPPLSEYIEEISSIWENRWLTNMGEKHQQLEQALASYLKTRHLSLFGNGHMALEFALQALHLSGEVITTPFTFVSTTHAIVRNGLHPIFCDVEPETGTMDVQKLESLITKKTSAIVPVHVYGNPCSVQEIETIAQRHNLKVIYDAAHAFGETLYGESLANFGDMSMYSFHATKVFHTIEGGAIACKNPEYLSALYNLKNFGIADAEHVVAVGGNSKMNEFQAAMGLCNLRHLDENILARKALVAKYQQGLRCIDGIRVLLHNEGKFTSNYSYFPVFFKKETLGFGRDDVLRELASENIFARKYFYPLTCDLACYKNNYRDADVPLARELAAGVLTLPLYEGLPAEKVRQICEIIRRMVASHGK